MKPTVKKIALGAGEALAWSIQISLNLRWIAQIRRVYRQRKSRCIAL